MSTPLDFTQVYGAPLEQVQLAPEPLYRTWYGRLGGQGWLFFVDDGNGWSHLLALPNMSEEKALEIATVALAVPRIDENVTFEFAPSSYHTLFGGAPILTDSVRYVGDPQALDAYDVYTAMLSDGKTVFIVRYGEQFRPLDALPALPANIDPDEALEIARHALAGYRAWEWARSDRRSAGRHRHNDSPPAHHREQTTMSCQNCRFHQSVSVPAELAPGGHAVMCTAGPEDECPITPPDPNEEVVVPCRRCGKDCDGYGVIDGIPVCPVCDGKEVAL